MKVDDYFVTVHYILNYMYEQLKKGKEIDTELLSYVFLFINETYYQYILKQLYKLEYIENITIYDVDNKTIFELNQNTMITPKGIAYLQFDEILNKAAKRYKK